MTAAPRSLVGGAAALLVVTFVVTATVDTQTQEPEGNFGVGVPEAFLPKYLAWRAHQLAAPDPDVMTVPLGYVKGLSESFTSMTGAVHVDLDSGAYTVELTGLTPLQTYAVWLLDTGDGGLLPDVPRLLTSVLALAPTTLLNGLLPINLPLGFVIDRIVVTPGLLPTAEPLGAGSVNVFQKLFFRRASLLDDSTGEVLFAEPTAAPAKAQRVPATEFETASSAGPSGRGVKMDKLISQGAELFFEETFNGNGRTCGTCHPASHNFTIDADFIATLPANDPLFVAEFNPALAQLERPALMRQFGLILENLDGFSAPTTKFVMRSVPHTLGLQTSLVQDTGLIEPPAEMTGWSGDGAPGTGSLREFAIGAVTQHFTKNLERLRGRDFKLPNDKQLDAMEAFQLSLGRSADFDIAALGFDDADVEAGRLLFINGSGDPNAGGRCIACHANAGAIATNLENRNFNTNVEDVFNPARSVQNFPIDGGFGRTANADGSFGNRTFNTPPVVEAADTAPFFHSNVVETLEGVVDFYSGPEFNNPRAAAARFNFDQTQRDQIADFMRAINTLQNIDVGQRELQEILSNTRDPQQEQDRRLQTAFDETQDGIDVLTDGGIFPVVNARLLEARNLISQAQLNNDPGQRRTLIQQAIAKLATARADLLT